MGLMVRYKDEIYTKDLLKKMICLPFLPHNHIRTNFDRIASTISPDDDILIKFKNYMLRQWICSNIHPLSLYTSVIITIIKIITI